jgi:hypothetical protein
MIEAALELRKVRSELSTLRARESSLRDQLMLLVGGEDNHDGCGLTASGVKVCHIDTSMRTTVSRDKLEALYPEVFADVSGETTVRTLRIDL